MTTVTEKNETKQNDATAQNAATALRKAAAEKPELSAGDLIAATVNAKTARSKKSAKAIEPASKKVLSAPTAAVQDAVERLAGIRSARAKKAAKTKAAKAPAKKAAAKKAAAVSGELKVRYYSNSGVLYFTRSVGERLGKCSYIAVEIAGRKLTLTPTSKAKDAFPIVYEHGKPVLRVKKLLKEKAVQWSGETQDLIAKPVGDSAFVVEVK